MLTTIASSTAGLIGAGIIVIGARFLIAPRAAAAGFGLRIDDRTQAQVVDPWLCTKGVRDIASGIFLLILLASGTPHLLGAFLVAASLIPVGDATIVLRNGGTRAAAFGIHGATALVLLGAGLALLSA